MTKPIETIGGLVVALGGSAAVSGLLGCKRGDVDAWIIQQWIPNGWHYRLDLAARRVHGLYVCPSVFDVHPEWPSKNWSIAA